MKLQKNWHIVPLKAKTKFPFEKNWQIKASSEVSKIKAWAKKFPGCSWGLLPSKSGLVVVDVDAKGLKEWKRLCKKYGEPKTLKALSGSGRGLHYVFKHERERSYRGKVVGSDKKGIPGLDVRFNNYIVIAPSMGSRQPYKWVNKIAPVSLPDWLRKRIVKPKRKIADKQGASLSTTFDEGFFRQIIDELREKEFDYETWLNIGMALHHASGGSEEGFELFEYLSTGANYQDGDEALARDKWESFDSDGDAIVTAGTLLKIAQDFSVKMPHAPGDPLDYFDDESEGVEQAKKTMTPKVKKGLNPDLWGVNKYGKQICEDPKELVNRINNEGFALLMSHRKTGSILRTFSRNGVKGFVEMTNNEFKNSIAHISLKVVSPTNEGQVKVSYKEGARVWLESQNKKRYTDIVFTPNKVKGALNLWGAKAIPCTPIQGSVDSILKYIKFVIAGGDETTFKYVMQWLAHIVQKPEQKPSVVPVIIGVEGTGKGLLTGGLMGGILGARSTMVSTRAAIKSKFNKDLAFKFLITLDEACWQGDNELQGILRSRTGNQTLEVEEKFGARYEVDDFARMIITANTPDAVKLQSSNRRYLILESPEKYANHNLLKTIWQDVRYGDACGKFYNHLLHVDLSDFDPHRFPKEIDRHGMATKIEGDIVREFLVDMLLENPRQIFYKGKGVVKADMFTEFQNFCESIRSYQKQISQNKFTRELKELVPVLKRNDKVIKLAGKSFRGFTVSPEEMVESFYAQLRLGDYSQAFVDEGFYIE